jgi:hypothetical protein
MELKEPNEQCLQDDHLTFVWGGSKACSTVHLLAKNLKQPVFTGHILHASSGPFQQAHADRGRGHCSNTMTSKLCYKLPTLSSSILPPNCAHIASIILADFVFFRLGVNIFTCSMAFRQTYSTVTLIIVFLVGGGTVLQAGRSRVSIPGEVIVVLGDLILPAALWPWGRLGL